jgi:endonuclease/exonuclease/phosphatase family metal-dependent hydrolase
MYSTLREFKPPVSEKLPLNAQVSGAILIRSRVNLLSWNLGYGGLGKEMDFFYEGGKMVRPDETLSRKYIQGIADAISGFDSIDVFLFQEVDFDSKRSYFLDQTKIVSKSAGDFAYTKAINYKSDFVPVPFMNPMGKVTSGLFLLSNFSPHESIRISTPGTYAWPKRLFMLTRCLQISKFNVEGSKELVVMNLHNSAFDDADALRDEELKLMRTLAMEEYQKGNYVIIGGDWNQNPPGLELNDQNPYKIKTVRPIPADLMPDGWTWAFDSRLPTNRDVDKPFDIATTTCSLIDFFLVSPNVEVVETRTVDLEFENSDHLPVILKVNLRN